MDVPTAKYQTELSRYANDGSICGYSPTNLSVIHVDTVDCPRLDPRSVGVVHHSNSLLRVGPKVKGTAISGPIWCRV